MKRTSPAGMESRRKSFTPHYQTFPTPPPKSRGKPPVSPSSSSGRDGSATLQQDRYDNGHEPHQSSPLPKKQLAILAVIAIAEQTALNSIAPYLPEMASTFPGVDETKVGLCVGTIASAFALAQFATSFFWGGLSDRIGRKPVVMLGTLLTASCFCAFGFCRTLWQAIIVQALLGLVSGNQGVMNTFLREITDSSNQSRAVFYLPAIYGIGGVTGPALGGLLVMQQNPFNKGQKNPYPYVLPNLFSATLLVIDLILTAVFLEESLEDATDVPSLKQRVENLFSWLRQFTGGAGSPTYLGRHDGNSQHRTDGAADVNSDEESTEAGESETQSLFSMPEPSSDTGGPGLRSKDVLNRNIILLLSAYLIFQLSNTAFNSLFPTFSSVAPPTGRGLSPREIGLSLSFAGVVAIVFRVGILEKLKEKMGGKAAYRTGLFGFFLAMMLMPWIPYRDSPAPFGWGSSTVWLWIEIGFVLIVKTMAAVGGLDSALLLVRKHTLPQRHLKCSENNE